MTVTYADLLPVSAAAQLTVAEQQVTDLVEGNVPGNGLKGAAVGPLAGIATFTDPAGAPDAGDFTATIAWGDGTTSAGTVVSEGDGAYRVDAPAHTYTTSGSFTVVTTVAYETLPAVTSGGQTIAVADQPIIGLTVIPPAAAVGQQTAANVVVAMFTDPAGGDQPSAFSAAINWGDDSNADTGTVVGLGGGRYQVTAPDHTYAAVGTLTLTVTVTHDQLPPVSAAGSVTVTVDQVTDVVISPPLGTAMGVPTGAITGLATFTDPDDDDDEATTDFSVTIEWGDGITSTGTVVSLGGGSYRVDAPAHTYPEAGPYTITVTIQHDSLTPLVTRATVTVSAPTASPPTLTGPIESVTTNEYNTSGELTRTIDGDNVATDYLYDAAGDVTAQIAAANSAHPITTLSEYDEAGLLTAAVDGDGVTTVTAYDADDLATAVTVGVGTTHAVTTRSEYDPAEILTAAVDGALGTTLTAYDPDGQPLTETVFNANGTVESVKSMAYDLAGLLSETTDGDGNETDDTYNALGQKATEEVFSLLGVAVDLTSYAYDGDGNLLSQIDVDGGGQQTVTDFAYDAEGNQTSETEGVGSASQIVVNLTAFDAEGHATQTADALGNLTSDVVDALGRVVSEAGTDPSGATTVTASASAYDLAGRLLSGTDGDGNVTSYGYDPLGRMLSQVLSGPGTGAPTADAHYYGYDDGGRQTATTDALSATTLMAFDPEGDATGTLDPTGAATTTQYDGDGRVTLSVDGDHNTTVTTYDADGHVLTATTSSAESGAAPVSVTDAYDGDGNRTLETDGDGNVTSWTYDADGRVLTTTEGVGSDTPVATTDVYDHEGRVIDATDGAGNQTFSTYNPEGWVLTEQVYDADGTEASAKTNTYDADGRVVEEQDQDGTTTSYAYDAAGRQTTMAVVMPGGNLVSTSAYDEDGNVTLATDPKGDVTATTYDADGRVLTQAITDAVTGQVASTTNVYDADGHLTQFTDADGNVTLTGYDADGDVTSVAVGDQTTTTEYDADQRATKVTDGDGDVTLSTYDAAGNVLTAVTESAAGVVVAAVTNAYDAAGRMTGMTDGLGNTTTYGYDAEGNQTAVDEPAVAGEQPADTTSAFDGDGRVTSLTDGAGNVTSTTYDAAGNVLTEAVYAGTTVVSSTTNTYDLAGHLTATTDGLGKSIDYEYDAAGRQTLIADLRDGAAVDTVTAYDAAGNATTTTDPLGTVTSVTYDDAGRPLTSAVYFGTTLLSATTSVYDADGNLTESIDAVGTVTQDGYDAAGNQTLAIDGDLTTTTEFDPAGRATKVTDPAGIVTSTTYDAAGNVTTEVTEVGGVVAAATTSAYDRDARLTQSIDPDGHVTQYGYDADGNQTLTVAGDLTTTTEFDGDHRATRVTDPALNVTLTTFDADGNVLTASTASAAGAVAASVTSSYDADGRLTQTVDGAGHTTATLYDGRGNVTATVDGTGATAGITTSVYDADNRVTALIDANGDTTLTAYDAEGRTTAVTAGAGTAAAAVTSYTYDADGRTLSETDPDNTTTTYSYDEDGRLTLQVDALGESTVTEYDGDGRPTALTDPDGRTTQSAYDAEGHATLVVWKDAGGTVTDTRSYVYDPDGNLLSATNATGTVSMGYDADGRMTSRTDPSGVTLTFHYDGDGRATLVTDSLGATEATGYDAAGSLLTASLSTPSGSLAATLGYDGAGELTSITRDGGTGGTATYARDDRGRVTGVTQMAGDGTTVEADTYGYDTGSRMTTSVVHSTSLTYGYDATNQMTSAGPATYTYDANGNRTGPGVVIDTGNRIHTDGTWVYTYDAAGNTVTKSSASLGTEWDYAYNDANEMTSATETVYGSLIETDAFAYDALGDRVSQTSTVDGVTQTTAFVTTDGTTAWADVTAGVGTTWYLAGNGPDAWLGRVDSVAGGAVYWDFTNPLGSVVAVASAAGVVLDQIGYDPFGAITAQTVPGLSGQVLFDGYRYDPVTGHYLTQTREYDPTTGRFTTQDPTGLGPDSNPYRYVGNGPMDGTDPTGRWLYVPNQERDLWKEIAGEGKVTFRDAGNGFSIVDADRSVDTHEAIVDGLLLAGVPDADVPFVMGPLYGGDRDAQKASPTGDLGAENRYLSLAGDDGPMLVSQAQKEAGEVIRKEAGSLTLNPAEVPRARVKGLLSQTVDGNPLAWEDPKTKDVYVCDVSPDGTGYYQMILSPTRTTGLALPIPGSQIEVASDGTREVVSPFYHVAYYNQISTRGQEGRDPVAVVARLRSREAQAASFRRLYEKRLSGQSVDRWEVGVGVAEFALRAVPGGGTTLAAHDGTLRWDLESAKTVAGDVANLLPVLGWAGRAGCTTGKIMLAASAGIQFGLAGVAAGQALTAAPENQWGYLGEATLHLMGASLSFIQALNKVCFAAGTPLRTPDGARAIEALRPGDVVLSRDEHDPLGDVVPKVIKEVFERWGAVWELEIRGQVIRTTAEHPFHVAGRGWVRCNELIAGDRILTETGDWAEVAAVGTSGAWERVYNVEVADYHTYFVGCIEWGFAVWAHNDQVCVKTVKAAIRSEGIVFKDLSVKKWFYRQISQLLKEGNREGAIEKLVAAGIPPDKAKKIADRVLERAEKAKKGTTTIPHASGAARPAGEPAPNFNELPDSTLYRTELRDRKGRRYGTPGNPDPPTVQQFNPRIREVRAGDLTQTNPARMHPENPQQAGPVGKLSNEDLTRLRIEDPISATEAPGGNLSLTGGHHRIAEIIRRVKSGQLSPNTLIRVVVHD
ncbi:polymorphic toxin-type HINT domain-containing protein [Fimbriiglobus ruber]|uniref:PKD domain-containing protein n=1 Tax=Fimbriiglobus ruber TaxID=1908690 RepID=A0A225DUK5_9BACT|nr:polymorphic toxin-type HINT domain-containing protein [Fimbriiglobus ruber]OWK41286.1 hypothetical protein FRUB_04649 [Fimbriiglobus ruber]